MDFVAAKAEIGGCGNLVVIPNEVCPSTGLTYLAPLLRGVVFVGKAVPMLGLWRWAGP